MPPSTCRPGRRSALRQAAKIRCPGAAASRTFNSTATLSIEARFRAGSLFTVRNSLILPPWWPATGVSACGQPEAGCRDVQAASATEGGAREAAAAGSLCCRKPVLLGGNRRLPARRNTHRDVPDISVNHRLPSSLWNYRLCVKIGRQSKSSSSCGNRGERGKAVI